MSAAAHDYSHFVQYRADGSAALDLILYDVDCAACFIDIENSLKSVPGLTNARVNVTYNRLHVDFEPSKITADAIIDRLAANHYHAKPFRINDAEEAERARSQYLIRCLAVATFAALNIMLLSISIWTGGVEGLSPETRDFFHWLSALIALPAAAYAGQPFYKNAVDGLRHGRWNMDVPISLGIILALGMSVYETAHHGEHAYFDSAVMLLTFLLLGRVLEQAMRKRTRAAAGNIAALKGKVAYRQMADGALVQVPVEALEVGDVVIIRAGDRVPADGQVEKGSSSLDESVITGETRPRFICAGDHIYAGSLSLDGTIEFRISGAGQSTLLDDISQLVEKAGAARSHYQRLADRAARFYAPVVHATAMVTALIWLGLGAGLHMALVTAISVLIITCPCALALAVPAVQVVAAGRLFHAGLFLNSPEALERLADIDFIVFDKTGTLTRPEPTVINAADLSTDMVEAAGFLACNSRHPLSAAIAQALPPTRLSYAVNEVSGAGVEAHVNGEIWRLGSADFCLIDDEQRVIDRTLSVIYLRRGTRTAALILSQALRSDAPSVIAALRAFDLPMMILSGDHEKAVQYCADQLGIENWHSALKPADKIAAIQELTHRGHKVLMVGDGLNDAPALASAHASLSPISAVDLAQAHADCVFVGERLAPLYQAVCMARYARRLMQQNLALAIIYNLIAVPLAVMGYVTPLMAALAMSASSLLVTLNALRLHRIGLSLRPMARAPRTSHAAHPAPMDV
jgi:P-type Cu2+ transporter